MAFTDEQIRAALNLEADADVNAELARILEERGTDPATAPSEPTATTEPAAPVVETPAAPVAQEPELVTLSAATYAELTEFAQERREQRRNEALDGAIRAGRIAPAERDHFAAAMARDEEGTITLLGQLAPRFAVSELGADHAGHAQVADDAFDEFERATFGLDRS